MPYCCATAISAISARAGSDTNATQARIASATTESGAFIKPRQHELAVAECLGRGESAVGGAEHHVEQLIARLAHRELPLQESGRVDIDVLAHRSHSTRIGANLDHREDGIADNVPLTGRKEVNDETCGRT